LKKELNDRSKKQNLKLKSAREQLDNIKLEYDNKANSIIQRQNDKEIELQEMHCQLKNELKQKIELNKLRKDDQLDN